MRRLTDDEINEIRAAVGAGGVSKKALARKYGVSPATIRYQTDPSIRDRARASREIAENKAKEKARSKRRSAALREAGRQRRISEGRSMPDGGDPEVWKLAMVLRGGTPERRKHLTVRWVYDKILEGRCEVTGLRFRLDDGPMGFYKPSLDRIVPGCQGGEYTPSNTRLVLWGYNQLKSDRTDEEVQAFLRELCAVAPLSARV